MADVGAAINPDMIRSILSAKGGADTPQNISSIKSFIASNPQMAERYAMGMRGSNGNDDNMDILQLEKQMDKTNGIAPASISNEMQGIPAPQVATSAVSTPVPKLPPMQGPQQPMASGPVNPMDGASPQAGAGGDGGGLWPMILAILGGGTAASMYANREPAVNRGNKNPSGAERQAAISGPPVDQKRIGYEPKLTDEMSDLSRLQTNEPAPTKVTNSPELNAKGKTAQLQAEVAAENDGAARLQEQMLQRSAGQNNTRDLLKRARGATGRK